MSSSLSQSSKPQNEGSPRYILQTILMALWSGWQQIQPEQFPFEDDVVKQLDSSVEQPTA